MCRPKTQGGRRCAKHLYANMSQEQKDAFNERRREAYAVAQDKKAAEEGNGILPSWRRYGFAKPKEVRSGWGNDEQAREKLAPIEQIATQWKENLSEDESEAVNAYVMTGYEFMNALLHGDEEFSRVIEANNYDEEMANRLRERYTPMINDMNKAITKAPKTQEPRVLYRSFIVHDPEKSAEDYAQENFAVGTELQSDRYLSTCMDSDFNLRYAKKHGAKNIVVFEVLTDQGAILHKQPRPHSYRVQDDEREVILPLKTGLTVVGVHHNVPFKSSREIKRYVNEGDKARMTVVQVVECSLLKTNTAESAQS